MKRARLLGLSTIVLALGLIAAGCDNGTTSDGVEDGQLAGSRWERKASSSGTSGFDFTYAYAFTSNSAGEYTQTGWGYVGTKKNTYNEKRSFTYIYEGAVNRIGVITQSGSKTTFSVSQDYKTLTVGSTKYTRK
jgi:hypothetical protein